MLEGLLSAEAAALYQRLLASGGVPVDQPLARSAAMRELIAAGFARERYVGEPRVVPVEPTRAVENAILLAQQRMVEQQAAIIRVREQLGALQLAYRGSSAAELDPHSMIQLFTDPDEIGTLSVELCLDAQHDVRNLETAHFRRAPDPRQVKVPPEAVLARGVRFRSVYARGMLELPRAEEMVHRAVEAGWEIRVVDQLPSKAVIVDGSAALLPLDPTGMAGAVLVRSPVVVGLLVTLFDMLWGRGIPLGAGGAAPVGAAGPGHRLSPVQRRVLRLLCSGLTDAAIARNLAVSERTVRRHVSALFDLLAVDNRVAAAAVAVREGWVEPADDAGPHGRMRPAAGQGQIGPAG